MLVDARNDDDGAGGGDQQKFRGLFGFWRLYSLIKPSNEFRMDVIERTLMCCLEVRSQSNGHWTNDVVVDAWRKVDSDRACSLWDFWESNSLTQILE